MYNIQMKKNFPPIEQISKAIEMADAQGRARDQRPLMFYLSRMTTVSPRLKGIINVRKTALSSFSYNIFSSDENEKLKTETFYRVKKVIDFLIQKFIFVPLYGALLIKIKYELINKAQVMSIEKLFHPTEVEKDFNNSVYSVDSIGSEVVRDLIEPSNVNYISATDEEINSGGVLRSLIFNEYLKDATIQEWALFNKRLKGLVQGTVVDESDKAVADNALSNLLKNQYAITSDQVKFVMNELTNSKSLDSFKEFILLLNSETAIAIIGQSNTTELPNQGGSRAALQVLNLIRNDILFADMLSLKKIINEQVLLYDYKLNYEANANESPLHFDFVFDEAKDVETNARMLDVVTNIGMPIKKDEAYKLLNLTVPTDGDQLLIVNKQMSF